MSKKIVFSVTTILIISLVVLIFFHQASKNKRENFVNEYAPNCGSYTNQSNCESNTECTWTTYKGKATPTAVTTVTTNFCTQKSS